jgi:hypothetical protein
MVEGEKIIPINIEEEMKTAYIDYSMSVIVSRATAVFYMECSILVSTVTGPIKNQRV